MRPTTTTALALAGAALALPAATLAAQSDDVSSTTAPPFLRPPLAGHLSVGSQMQAERQQILRERLTPRVLRVSGRIAHVKGRKFSRRAERRRLRSHSADELRTELRHKRRELRRAKRAAAARARAAARAAATATATATATSSAPATTSATTATGGSTASPNLEAIAACESGGNPSAVGGGGAYRGKYQFSYSTWAAVGGSGDPAAASEAEQDQRAAMLYSQAGASQWPVCGR